ncbi:MAG: hypothetical protein ACI8XB_002175 [Patiriisocius sp.]
MRLIIFILLPIIIASCAISQKHQKNIDSIKKSFYNYPSPVHLTCSIDSIPKKKNWEFYSPNEIKFVEESQYMHLPNPTTLLQDSFLIEGNCKRKWFKENLLIKEESFGENDSVLGSVRFLYDKNNLKIALLSDGIYINGTTEYFVYDQNELTIIWYRKHSKHAIDMISTYEYDSIGRPIKEVQWEIPDSNSTVVKKYMYDGSSPYPIKKEFNDGVKSGISEYSWNQAKNEMTQKMTSSISKDRQILTKYGQFGDVIENSYSEGGLSTIYTYIYDERGNWIVRYQFGYDGKEHITTYRKIIYSKRQKR